MTDLEQRAREMLAAACEEGGGGTVAAFIRGEAPKRYLLADGVPLMSEWATAAIIKALSREAELEEALTNALDHMEYFQRWRSGQQGATPDMADGIERGRSTLHGERAKGK